SGLGAGRAVHYTLGGQVNNGAWMLDLEFYHKKTTGLTEYRLPSMGNFARMGSSQLFQGSGTSSGFDLFLQWRRADFVGWMSYSFNNSRIRYPDYPGLGSFPADEDTPHTLRLSGNYTHGGWDLSFTWSFASGRPYTTPDLKAFFDGDNGLVLELASPPVRNDNRLPDNHNLDLRVSRSFATKFVRGEWSVSLLNVYDRQNSWYRYYIVSVGRRAPVDVRTLGFVPMISAKLQLN
ncbi:TonB-dependent receptor, partial [bacterium]|nr:TonB-dependent receptor [bacterium]